MSSRPVPHQMRWCEAWLSSLLYPRILLPFTMWGGLMKSQSTYFNGLCNETCPHIPNGRNEVLEKTTAKEYLMPVYIYIWEREKRWYHRIGVFSTYKTMMQEWYGNRKSSWLAETGERRWHPCRPWSFWIFWIFREGDDAGLDDVPVDQGFSTN